MNNPSRHPITKRRRERGMSRAQVCARIGAPETALAAWERGRDFPTPVQAIRLARCIGLSLAEIYITLIEQQAAAGHIPPLVDDPAVLAAGGE